MKVISFGTFALISTVSTPLYAVSISGQGSWETTLQGRDLDGNLSTAEAYYDTSQHITWLANANYAGTMMGWDYANTWAAALNINGYTGWRLPIVNPIDGTTANDQNISYIGTEDRYHNVSAPGTRYAGSTASEMAHMFYNTLGDKSYCDPTTSTVSSCNGPQPGWGLTNTGPFSNIQSRLGYWSATGYAPNTENAWTFHFSNGLQIAGDGDAGKAGSQYAWAVHAGDVGTPTVPVPAAVWLLGSGLVGLMSLSRRHLRLSSKNLQLTKMKLTRRRVCSTLV